MQSNTAVVDRLVAGLRRFNIDHFASVLLDAAGPLALLGAQALYLLEPLVGNREGLMADVAHVLEDPDRVKELSDRLRQEEDLR